MINFPAFFFASSRRLLSAQRSGKLIRDRNPFPVGIRIRRKEAVILVQPRVPSLQIQMLADLPLQGCAAGNRMPAQSDATESTPLFA